MKTVYEVIEQALGLWIEATGVDPNESEFAGFWGEVRGRNLAIKEAQELDPSGITTFMVLRASARSYAEEQNVTALEYLEKGGEVRRRMASLRRLLEVLNDKVAMAEVRDFQKELRKSAAGSGLSGVFDSLIDDIQELAYIRRDALRALRTLKTDHFSAGARSGAPARYNEYVVKFWNVNSAIRAAQVQPEDGVTMVMLRDPHELFSFFGLLVKNGENIVLLSDVPEVPHPLHKGMSRARAQERRWEERAFRLRFPYQLFDFEFSEDARDRVRYVPKHGELVPVSLEAVKVKKIRELEPDQALWALMMFDLVKDVHWRREPIPVALSYTGEGTALAALPAPAAGTLIVPGSKKLEPLTRADMKVEQLKDVWERDPTGQNYWMADRYADKVPEALLNLVGSASENAPDRARLLTDGSEVEVKELVPKGVPKTDLMDGHRGRALAAVDPMAFGAAERMESDRKFVARYNQAVTIDALARAEFKRRGNEVKKWYEAKVRANTERLVEAMCRGTFPSEIQGKPPGEEYGFEHGIPQPGEILRLVLDTPKLRWTERAAQVQLYGWRERGRDRCRCFLTGRRASVWGCFDPYTAKSVADLAGCSVEDLPDVVRHWTLVERYDGNCILDRIDPLEWACKNPWRELKFDVVVALSKSAFLSECRRRGLKPPKTKEES